MGLVSKKQVFKPMLTMVQKRARLLFARKYRGWSVGDWSRIIFSDKKIFRVRPGGHVRHWVPKSASKFDARYFYAMFCYISQTTCRYLGLAVQKPQGLMVWAAINGRGELVLRRCPPKVKSLDYQATLGTALRFIKPRYLPTSPTKIINTILSQVYESPISTG